MSTYDQKCSSVVYYIYNNALSSKHELKQYYNLLYGFIEVVNHIQEKSMTITNLQSTHTGNGYATHLILCACDDARKLGITTVNLDDCSSRYRSNHNIYTKLGMKYENCDGGPEMIGKVRDIVRFKSAIKTIHPVIYRMVLNIY